MEEVLLILLVCLSSCLSLCLCCRFCSSENNSDSSSTARICASSSAARILAAEAFAFQVERRTAWSVIASGVRTVSNSCHTASSMF